MWASRLQETQNNNEDRNVFCVIWLSTRIDGDDNQTKMSLKLNYVFECVSYSLTSGHQGRPGHTPYTRVDHGTCGGVASLEVPGPSGHCPLLDTPEKTK